MKTPHRDLVLHHVQLDVMLRECPDLVQHLQQEAAIEFLAGLVMNGIAWTFVLLIVVL